MEQYIDEIYKIAHDNNILLSLTIELLTYCNENCVHCYIPQHNLKGIETKKIKEIISEFRAMGGLNLTLTGGEIFLRDDLFEIIQYARSLNLRVFLLTNATLISKDIAIKLKELSVTEISVSVYSLDEKIHDQITRYRGSLKRTLQALEYAKEVRLPVTVKTPLMELNKYSYRDLKIFCKENGFKYMASSIIFSKSNGDSSVKELSIKDENLCSIVKEIESLESTTKHNAYEEACGCLKYMLAIDAEGNVYPCNSLYYKVGNVYMDTLTEIWERDKLKEIQNIKKTDLPYCSKCKLKKVCSRCPGLALLEDGDYMGCSSTAYKNAKLRLYLNKI